MQLYRNGDFYHYHSDKHMLSVHPVGLGIREINDGRIRISVNTIGGAHTIEVQEIFLPSNVLDREGNKYGDTVDDVLKGINTGVDVNITDQTTHPVFQKFNQVHNSTTLFSQPIKGLSQIAVVDATGIVVGSHIIIFDPASVRFSSFTCIAISGVTVTLDSPLDFEYPAGSYVDVGITNMNVDGSVTPQVFGIRGTGVIPGVKLTMDVTRLIFKCKTDTGVDLSKFGDIARLTKGLLCRKRDGVWFNVFNVKSNGDLAGLLYDWNPYSAQNSQQGQDGFVSRLTLTKLGVVVRLPIGEDLEFIIQDDLTNIQELEIMAEGHLTNDY